MESAEADSRLEYPSASLTGHGRMSRRRRGEASPEGAGPGGEGRGVCLYKFFSFQYDIRRSAAQPGSRRTKAAPPIREPRKRMSIRTVTATRYVTPLREGGSLPAIVEADDDGMYVLKFWGAGPEGADRRARRGGARPRDRAAGAGDRLRRSRSGAGADRARSGDPGADQSKRRSEPGARLPPRRRDIRRGGREGRSGARFVDRLVRRLCDQHRPDAAEHQHADVAPAALADRSRRGALLSPRLEKRAGAEPRPLSDDQRACPAHVGEPALGGRRDARRTAAAGGNRRDRQTDSGPLAGGRSRRGRTAPGRLPELSAEPAGAAARFLGGGDRCKITPRMTMRSFGWFRGSTAANSSMSG